MIRAKHRNPQTVFKFFSPFIANSNSLLSSNFKIDIESKKISEYIKIERFYLYDAIDKKRLEMYDQFLNEIIIIDDKNTYQNEIDFVNKHCGEKNIIYSYRPIQIIDIANRLCNALQEINIEETKEYKAIAEYIHKDYNVLKFLKKGIVCHYSSMPEIIKMYIEKMYSSNNDIKYIITTSTLLQGVNIPAVKIFLFSNKCGRKNSYLSSSSFKNLIGRTCRFSEIFSPHNKDFNLLQPEIYIVKTTFFNSRTNIEDYISKVANMTKETKDDIKNEMLKEKNTEKYEKEIEYLENMERGTISKQTINICRTVIGKLCFENNVRDFEIIKNEETLNDNYTEYVISHNILISNEKDLLSAIFEIFLKNIETDKSQGENFVRLKDVKARNFYQMLLEWKINNYPYNRMIKH